MHPAAHVPSSPGSSPALSPALRALQERLIGTLIGSYRVTRLLGYGGMGAVFEAQQQTPQQTMVRRAAVKVLSFAGPADDQAADAVKRFLAEAKALSTVRHEGLVQLLDSGQLPDGTVYILMEYLGGESLAARLARGGGRLPLERALGVVRQIASALCEVHGKGIVHRDLTPSNLFLVQDATADGGERVKLLDFGIAKIRGERERCTKTGECFGTPRYMAPEQCEGSAHIDDRADIYTLGVLLFELLTGQSPYSVESGEAMAWMFAHVSRRPRKLAELVPAVPVEIARLVAEMLDKVPAQRPSAAQVVMQLRRYNRLVRSSGRSSDSGAELVLAVQVHDDRLTMARRLFTQRLLPTLALLGVGLGVVSVGGQKKLAALWERVGNKALAAKSAALVALPPAGMVLLHGQRLLMGSSEAEVEAALATCQKLSPPDGASSCRRDSFARELPERSVTVRSFYLDQKEVTNREYADWLNRTPLALKVGVDSHGKDRRLLRLGSPDRQLADFYFAGGRGSGIERQGGHFFARAGFAELPVVQVTWYGAREYCQGQGRDLPSEAQWEFAARDADTSAGTSYSRYPWGDDAPHPSSVWMAAGAAWGDADPLRPQPVGTATQDRTPSGIFDLGGNVSEWVLDRFVAPYPDCGACIDPLVTASPTEGPGYHVIRGGSFTLTAVETRSATRSRWAEDQTSESIGFRCAAAATATTAPGGR